MRTVFLSLSLGSALLYAGFLFSRDSPLLGQHRTSLPYPQQSSEKGESSLPLAPTKIIDPK